MKARLACLALLLAAAAPAVGQAAPVAFDDAYSTPQGDNLSVDAPGVLANDEDADGDPLTAVLVDSSQAVGQLFLFSDGSFEYEPGGFVGVESFTYRASDGTQDSNEATITFTVTAGTASTTYIDEASFLGAVGALGLAARLESFEDDAVWGLARSPVTAPRLTRQGLTWSSEIGNSQVTTGPGPALLGNWGFFALPHGDYLAGPQCLQPGVCTDRWNGHSGWPLVAIGGWIKSAGQGKVVVHLDGDTANPIGFGGIGTSSGYQFFGVVAPTGFHDFEFREMEGTSGDAVYLFGDGFTFARAPSGVWSDLGLFMTGSAGNPSLAGVGTLEPSSPITISLTGARPFSTAWLCFGLGAINAPFFGGTFVPDISPPGFALPLFTDEIGSVIIADRWPAGIPSGFSIHLQYWIEDAGALFGFAASNGLRGTTP